MVSKHTISELAKAHTGEHILFQCLSRLVPGISLVKIFLSEKKCSLFVKCEHLDFDILSKAQQAVNCVIAEAKPVLAHTFSSIEEAIAAFPKARMREERIKGKLVRIIEIKGFDWAACSGEHVENTAQIEFFLITGLSKAGRSVYEINFSAGEMAKKTALELSSLCLKTAEALGTTPDKLVRTATNLKSAEFSLRKKFAKVSKNLLAKLQPREIAGKKLYASFFEAIDRNVLTQKAGKLIGEPNSIAIFVIDDGFIVMARSKDIELDLTGLLKRIGRGGGKPNFVTGQVDNPKAALPMLIEALEKQLK